MLQGMQRKMIQDINHGFVNVEFYDGGGNGYWEIAIAYTTFKGDEISKNVRFAWKHFSEQTAEHELENLEGLEKFKAKFGL